MLWRSAKKGLTARVFWGYLAVAMIFAVASPGMAVFASDSRTPEEPPVAEPVVVPAPPVAEPAIEPAPGPAEPVVEEPAPVPVEEPVVEPAPVPAEEPVVDPAPVKTDRALAPVQQPLIAASVVLSDPVPPSDRGVTPVYVAGNPGCDTYNEFKLEGIAVNGTYTTDSEGNPLPGGASITISNGGEYSFDFSAVGVVIHGVIVKASPGANVYSYGATGVSDDGNLWSVPKDTTGFHEISHITFCWSETEPEPLGSIVVYKFMDDGTHEWPGDGPFESVEFVLYDADDVEIDRGFTGPDGTLTFSDLPMGDYFVEEIEPAGWHNTTGLRVAVTLACPLTADIGAQCEEIVEYVYFGNARDVYTKTFELTYSHQPAELDAFRVEFTLNGDFQSLDLVLDGDVYTASIEVVYPYEIADVVWWGHGADGWIWLGSDAGLETLTGDLTNYFHYDPSLSGHKWEDQDGDGIWGDEPAIPGWTIYLYRLPDPQLQEVPSAPAGAVLVATTVTDANGYYEFTGMLPGLYWVAEEERPGWTPTAWPTDQPIWVGNGTDVTDLDFGNMRPAEKTFEFTFIDAPEDLSYWVRYWIEGESYWLELTGDNPFAGSIEVTVGTTISQVDWIVYQGVEEFVLGTTGPETIDEDMLNEFEYRSHIGGYKFDDEDGEGDWDEGEPPIGGWKITLFREVSSPPIEVDASAIALFPVGETYTDGEGYWEFNGLLPGTYLVQEEDREGWEMTVGPDGTFEVTNGTDRDDLIFGNTQFVPFTELDLAITKVADVEWADPGDLVTYTLTYWNNGEIPAENYTIVDDYDERYMTPVNTAGGVVSGGKITWSLPGPLAAEDGPQTIVYTMRVDSDMPGGTTNLDNDVVIDHPRDKNPDNNFDDERVRVKTADEPFLPFTGGEALILLGAAMAAAAAGVGLRVRSAHKE